MYNKIISQLYSISTAHEKTGRYVALTLPRLSTAFWLGLVPRLKKKFDYTFNHLNYREVERRITEKIPHLYKIIQAAHQQDRFVYYQPGIDLEKEHFIAIIGEQFGDDPELNLKAFKARALRMLNPYYWKIGQQADMVVNMDIIHTVDSFERFGEKKEAIYTALIEQEFIDKKGRTRTKFFGLSKDEFINNGYEFFKPYEINIGDLEQDRLSGDVFVERIIRDIAEPDGTVLSKFLPQKKEKLSSIRELNAKMLCAHLNELMRSSALYKHDLSMFELDEEARAVVEQVKNMRIRSAEDSIRANKQILLAIFPNTLRAYQKKFRFPGLTSADKRSIYEMLEPDIYINGKYIDCKYSDEESFIRRLQHKWQGQKNPYDVLDTILDGRNDFINGATNIRVNNILSMISDQHLGDGSRTDNFKGKVADLLAHLKYLKDNNIPLVILGDLFEGLQAKFQNIFETYPEIYQALSELQTVIYLPGNHDRKAYEDKDLFYAIKELLPNIQILPNFFFSSEKVDIYADHGHMPDTWNNASWKGDTIAKAVAGPEHVTVDKENGRSHVEQALMSFVERRVMPNSMLARANIIGYLSYFNAVISMYMYFNKGNLSETEKKTLLLAFGHTHLMFRHNEPSSLLQQTLYKIIDRFPEVKHYIDVKLVNTGGWSGENMRIIKTPWWRRNIKVMTPMEDVIDVDHKNGSILYSRDGGKTGEFVPLNG